MQKDSYLDKNFQSIFAWSEENTFGETLQILTKVPKQKNKCQIPLCFYLKSRKSIKELITVTRIKAQKVL